MRPQPFEHVNTGEVVTQVDIMKMSFYKEYDGETVLAIKRDGATVAYCAPREGALLAWFHAHRPFSMDWALKNEGYSYEEIPVSELK